MIEDFCLGDAHFPSTPAHRGLSRASNASGGWHLNRMSGRKVHPRYVRLWGHLWWWCIPWQHFLRPLSSVTASLIFGIYSLYIPELFDLDMPLYASLWIRFIPDSPGAWMESQRDILVCVCVMVINSRRQRLRMPNPHHQLRVLGWHELCSEMRARTHWLVYLTS